MVTDAISLRDYRVTIDTGRRGDRCVEALRQIDLAVAPGSVTALVGESGCGKSLVARALSGLLPPGSHTAGDLEIRGERVTTEKQWRRLRGRVVGSVPQSPATSFTPVRTVGSQLAEIVRALGGRSSPLELADTVDLPRSALDLFPHQLSGGMAQRAAIAAAIAGNPEIVVADEPTSALDPDLSDDMWDLFGELAADGRAVLVITHDVESLVASGICGRIAVMMSGRVLTEGSADDVVGTSDPYVSRFFAGVRA